MKKRLFIVTILVIIGIVIIIANTEKRNDVVDFINATYSQRQFTTKHISDEIIQQVLQAGHKAPSAGNQQPWHFTVIRNKPLIDEIMNNVVENNVLIVVSALKEHPRGFSMDFDSALATQNMFLVAQALGVGARMYVMPLRNLNENHLHKLNVPDDYRAYMILRLGYEDESVDATTAASPRQPLENKVNFIN